MRTVLVAITIVVICVLPVAAQDIIVAQASSLEWDYDLAADYVVQFNVYLSRTATIVPNGVPTASVAWPTLEWTIGAGPGRWYAVVTAIGNDVDATESAPSNEVAFIVLGPPTNLRIVK